MRKLKYETVIRGVRVRVYATRNEYEVIFNDEDIADVASEVYCYPKIGGPEVWADQGYIEYSESLTTGRGFYAS